MIAVTLGGQSGAGEFEVGRLIARELGGLYVHQQAIRRLARLLGASVEAVVRKEMAFASRWRQMGHLLEAWLSQMGRTGSEPWTLPLLTSEVLCQTPQRKELPGEISNDAYRRGVFAVADQYAQEGNIVLANRAGCLTLEHRPEVVHIGLFALRDMRVSRVASRYRIGQLEASDWVDMMDKARAAWFKELAGAHPHDPDLYDIAVDATRFMDDDMAARNIALAVMDVHHEARAPQAAASFA
jgi:cytidylate kinase